MCNEVAPYKTAGTVKRSRLSSWLHNIWEGEGEYDVRALRFMDVRALPIKVDDKNARS